MSGKKEREELRSYGEVKRLGVLGIGIHGLIDCMLLNECCCDY